MHRLLATRILAVAAGLGVLSGCGVTGERIREYTYPPSFEYVGEARLQSSMWVLAREVEHLEDALRRPPSDPAAQQREVSAILKRMEAATERIDAPGRETQHPLLNRHLPRFQERVRQARRDAAQQPPRYFAAATLAGSCSACHGGAER